VVTEGLLLGFPNRSHVLGPHVADLESFRQWRVGLVVQGGSDHLERVPDRHVPGTMEEGLTTRCTASRLCLEEVQLGGRESGVHLPHARLDRGEHGRADPSTAPFGAQEADDLEHAGPIRLLAPRAAGVADDRAVHLDKEEVASRVAAREVVVEVRESVQRRDEVVAVGDPALVGHVVHPGVIGPTGEVAEDEAAEAWQMDRGGEGSDRQSIVKWSAPW